MPSSISNFYPGKTAYLHRQPARTASTTQYLYVMQVGPARKIFARRLRDGETRASVMLGRGEPWTGHDVEVLGAEAVVSEQVDYAFILYKGEP